MLLVPAFATMIAALGASSDSPHASSSPPGALVTQVIVQPASSTSRAATDSSADDARAQSLAEAAPPFDEVAPQPAPRSKGVQQKTAERRALDAVAAGVGDAEQYDALAKEHPDNPAFSEAARILRAHAANEAAMSSRSVKEASAR